MGEEGHIVDAKNSEKPKRTKSKMISFRVTEAQYRKFEEMTARIQKFTGFRVNRTSMLLLLMQYGLPQLEKKYPSRDLRDPPPPTTPERKVS